MQHLISLYSPGQRDQLTTDAQRRALRRAADIGNKSLKENNRVTSCCIRWQRGSVGVALEFIIPKLPPLQTSEKQCSCMIDLSGINISALWKSNCAADSEKRVGAGGGSAKPHDSTGLKSVFWRRVVKKDLHKCMWNRVKWGDLCAITTLCVRAWDEPYHPEYWIMISCLKNSKKSMSVLNIDFSMELFAHNLTLSIIDQWFEHCQVECHSSISSSTKNMPVFWQNRHPYN